MSNKVETLNAVIEHLNSGDIAALGELLADEGFSHQAYPTSLNMPLRNKSEFLQYMHDVKKFIASFNVRSICSARHQIDYLPTDSATHRSIRSS
jgi:hypothetical protein